MSNLKFPKRCVALVSVVEHSKNEMAHLLLFADFDGFCHQGICGPFILLALLGKESQDRSDISSVNQLHDSEQFVSGVGANVVAPVEK
ncbi:MAG: hypothetical protein DMG96_21795 [Acidobacteria bacterium]|nr:MAG: hypothetical protein DMG96_21795 [Acidobacteriota bacterium]